MDYSLYEYEKRRNKNHVDNFDVSMGAYDSAEVVDTLGCIVNLEQVGLYQKDGFIFILDSTASRPQKYIRAFKLLDLRIQIASNLKIVDFLDVTLNLNNGTFKPFSKNNSASTYVNIDSNHSLPKQIANAANQRINRRSACKRIFEEGKSIYDEALKNSGLQGRVEYVNPVNSGSNGRNNSSGICTHVKVGDTNNNHSNRRGKYRNRTIIWFNPPFCKLTNINIGKYFLNLLDKYFNKDNPLRISLNRNTVKISYSCTKNIHSILNNHNRRLLDELNRNSGASDVPSCNCISKEVCPLGGRCNLKNVVYQACISPMEHNNDGERVYIGISAGNWKQWSQTFFLQYTRLRNQTTLSKHFWCLMDQEITSQIKWKIVRQSSTANSFNGRCNLCIDEKICIINFKGRRLLLNEWNEFVFKCRHKSKFRLSWLGATKAPTLDKSRNIDVGWVLLELITFISVVDSTIWRGDLCRGEDSWKFRY